MSPPRCGGCGALRDTLEDGKGGVREEGLAAGSERRPGVTWWGQVAVKEHVPTGRSVQLVTKLQLPYLDTANGSLNISGSDRMTLTLNGSHPAA